MCAGGGAGKRRDTEYLRCRRDPLLRAPGGTTIFQRMRRPDPVRTVLPLLLLVLLAVCASVPAHRDLVAPTGEATARLTATVGEVPVALRAERAAPAAPRSVEKAPPPGAILAAALALSTRPSHPAPAPAALPSPPAERTMRPAAHGPPHPV